MAHLARHTDAHPLPSNHPEPTASTLIRSLPYAQNLDAYGSGGTRVLRAAKWALFVMCYLPCTHNMDACGLGATVGTSPHH